MLNTQAVTKNLFLNKISLFFIAKDNIEKKSKANRKKMKFCNFMEMSISYINFAQSSKTRNQFNLLLLSFFYFCRFNCVII